MRITRTNQAWFCYIKKHKNNTIMKNIRLGLITIIFFLIPSFIFSQTDAGVKIMPKQGDLYENVKELNNPYALPLWGKKLGAKGFLLPYPIGIMLNGYVGSQDVTISNLSVGFNNNQMISLDDVVTFGDVSATIRNFNMRGDIWLLPFLDIYGIFGKAWVNTDVNIGAVMNQPVDLHTEADFDGYVYGFGTMLTGGARSIFFSLDFNMVWSHFDEMKEDNYAINLSPRVGYIFHFEGKPERNLSVWTGATRVFLNNATNGTINVSDIIPNFGENYKNQTWYQNLEQERPKAAELVDQMVESVVQNHKDDVINYSLEKRPSHNWAMILGIQYQIDRHWQLRTETNFLGGRKSGLISVNYRFGIK